MNLLFALACASDEPDPPPPPSAEAGTAGWATPCAGLPDRLRPHGHVELALHDYERPEARRRFWLHRAGEDCAADDLAPTVARFYAERVCVPVEPDRFEELWRALAPLRAVRVRAAPERPHHGGRSLAVAWDTGACAVDLADYTEVHPADQALVVAALDAVQATGAAATPP